MKKVIAGILAVLCVAGSVNTNWVKSGTIKESGTSITAAAATVEVPSPGKNAGSYKYPYADTSRYTTTFTSVKIIPNPDAPKETYEWKSSDGKYTYGIYKVEVKLLGEKEAELTEYVVGISKANENVIDVDLSQELEVDPQVLAFLNNNSISIDWSVGYLAPSVFANSYLKTIKLDGVKYIDKSVFSKCAYITDIVIPASVRYVGTGVFSDSGLKSLSIENDMPIIPQKLCSNTKLTDLKISRPALIKRIDDGAFQGSAVSVPLFMTESYGTDVSKYESLIVGKTAYSGCTNIKEVALTDNIYGIDKDSFNGCTALNSITFNKKLIAIGGGAFQGCTALKEVKGIPETVGDWVVVDKKDGSGYGFGDGVFSNCTNLVECYLPDALTIIPDSTFKGCTALTTVGFNSSNIGENIYTIGPSAFEKCTSLKDVNNFPNAVIIGPSAYSGCTKLLEVSFPSAVYIGGTEDSEADERGSIVSKEFDTANNEMKGGGSTFSGCTSLKTVNIESSRYIFPNSFKNCSAMTDFTAGECEIVGNNALDGCSAMKEITLLSKQYGNAAPTKSNTTNGFTFQNCSSAETITIDAAFLVDFPNKTPNGFFNGCKALKTINTKNGDFSQVQIVSNKTFSGCESLEALKLDSIIIVEDDAFSNCTSLKKISSSDNFLQAVDYGKNAFLNCSDLKFTITGSFSTIGNSAFKNSGVTAVNIVGMTGGTVVISDSAFSDCQNLTTATIKSGSAAKFSIGNSIFANCPVLKEAVYEGQLITQSMFQNCPELKYITTNAKNIKASAFEGDALLRMVRDMNDTSNTIIADEIGASAFKDCAALEVIPADEHTVLSGNNTFMNCAKIRKADIGMLKAGTFSGCTSLKDVTMTGVTEIPNNAFTNCISLKEIDIAEMLNIGTSAFSGTGLENVVLNNAQTVGTSAFANCGSLKSIDIVAVSIGSKAFAGSEFLEDAVMNVDNVLGSAFEGCASLRNVTFQSSGSHALTELGSSAFNNCNVLYELILEGNPKMGTKCAGFVSNKVNGDFILVGESGSTVEAYAKSNNVEFCDINEFDLEARKLARNVPGDVDGNTVISVADAVKLQSWLLNKSTPGVIGSNMDVNGDGRVDAYDMIAMRQKLIGK